MPHRLAKLFSVNVINCKTCISKTRNLTHSLLKSPFDAYLDWRNIGGAMVIYEECILDGNLTSDDTDKPNFDDTLLNSLSSSIAEVSGGKATKYQVLYRLMLLDRRPTGQDPNWHLIEAINNDVLVPLTCVNRWNEVQGSNHFLKVVSRAYNMTSHLQA